jgi:D-serine deaminase-like pyridoxal phosphate-dependent protein
MSVASSLPGDLETPCLVVDVDILDRNLLVMAASAREHSLALRPHAKTHKCLEIARRQLQLGAVGLTVATVSEAEVFARAGFTDLFIAYPVWAVGAWGNRLWALANQAVVRIGVDSAEGAAVLARAAAGSDIEVLVEVDSGHHRTGVSAERAGEVALSAVRAGLRVSGIFTFPGHGYNPGARGQAAADESRALLQADAALRHVGVEVSVRSGGSTPTAEMVDNDALTEMRPGVYVFNDAQQVELDTCAWDNVALTAAATVVSRSGRRLVLDAGSKVLGADRPTWTTGAGRLPDHPGARVTTLSEHHATVAFPDDERLPELGSILRVAPNHVCAAVNLADELIITVGGAVVDRWPVTARGANS